MQCALQNLGQDVSEQLGKLYSFKEEKARYRKSYINWDKIKRANNKAIRQKAKHLSKDAQAILAPVIQGLKKGKRVFFNHKYISSITQCERGQNRNIIKQLETVLDITYHNSITVDGKKHRFSYEFAYYKQEIAPKKDNSTAQFIEREKSLNPSNQASFDTYIKNNNTESIRSNVHAHESNFSQNTQEIKREENTEPQITELAKEPVKHAKLKTRPFNERKKRTNAQAKARIYKPFAYAKPKTLTDMLPLIDHATCDELRSRSGRPFSDNFITQLILKMSRNPKRRVLFNYRSGFIAYMAKALQYEKHDAVKTGNINFRFKANIPVNSNEPQEQENLPEPLKLPEGIWGDICQKLIVTYDEYTYKNWLSRLVPVIDEQNKTIELKAPNSFTKQWIETNYQSIIEKTTITMGLTFKEIIL